MDIFKDAELIFADTYAQKPARTLKIHTSAPVQPTTVAVPPSSGVATFSSCQTYEDRFILWRALGNKLFLEERSICRTVVNGSLCLDFGRTTIVPGTSITIENSVLCIVVPTQSAVHRFMARLIPDIMDHVDVEVQSLFTQVTDKDFMGDAHSYALLTTNAEVKKASVVSSMNATKVAYCMVDGQLVLITLPVRSSEKSEEMVLREGGLISRIMNSGGSDFLCDVAGIVTSKGHALFYAIYSDATLRIWPVDKQVRSSTIIKLSLTGSKIEGSTLSLRVGHSKGLRIISIAACENHKTIFHNFADENNTLSFISSSYADIDGVLLDYQLVLNNENGVQIFAVWDSNETGGYQFLYTSINSEEGWTSVQPPAPVELDYTKLKLQQIKEIVNDTDMHSFDVVLRAVQISSGISQYDVAHNDWKGLQTHIEAYLRSSEITEKYGDRNVSRLGRRLSTVDSREYMQRRFYETLAATCEQLVEASRGAIGIFNVDLDGASLQGIIQKDRFSIIHQADPAVTVEATFEAPLAKIFHTIQSAKDSEESESDEELDDRVQISDDTAERCIQLMQTLCSHTKVKIIKPTAVAFHPFRGRFTAGLAATIVRHTVKVFLSLADVLLSLASILRKSGSEFAPRDTTVQSLTSLQQGLSFLSKMFEIKMMMTNNMVNALGSWLFSITDLKYIRSEGAAINEATQKMDYNWFLNTTLESSLRALWPSSPYLVACRLLAENARYITLKKVCALYDDSCPSFLKSAINFYTGIAYCGLGQAHKASNAFEASFDGIERKDEALHRALKPMGDVETVYSSLGDIYTKAIRTLHEHGHEEEVVRLAKTAIECLPEGDQNKNRIYATLFNQLVHHNKWAEALDSIKRNKDPKMRDMTLRDFMTRILRANEWKTVTELDFGELEEQVENILLSAARLQEVVTSPHLFEVMFSYYIDKSRLNKAVQVMLEYAYCLQQASQSLELFKRRRNALAAALTVLEMIPKEDRYTFFPEEVLEEIDDEEEAVVPDGEDNMMDTEIREPNIPKTTVKRRRVLIVEDTSVHREWSLAKARLVILEDAILPPSEPQEILKLLIEAKHYDDGLDVCREFDIDPTKLLFAVTTDTIMLDVMQPVEMPSWTQQNRRHVNQAFTDNWSVVRGLLSAAHRIWPTDSRPYRAVTTAILSHAVNVPCWLQAEYSDFDLPDFVRCLIDYDSLPMAIDYLTEHIRRETEKVIAADAITFVPYNILDEVITLASSKEDLKPMLTTLNAQLRRYLERVSGFESAQRFGS